MISQNYTHKMRHQSSILALLLVAGAAVVRGVNEFTNVPTELTADVQEVFTWKDFSTTDLKNLVLKSDTDKSVSITLRKPSLSVAKQNYLLTVHL